MGKYDIDAKFNEEYKLTKSELISEVMDEYNLRQEEGTIRRQFDNIINHITKNWGIDIRSKIKGNDKKEKFDSLKILKLLYAMKRKYSKNIMKILDNPSLENIDSPYSENGMYSVIIEDLYSQVKKQISCGEEIVDILNDVDLEWSVATERLIRNPLTAYYNWYPKVEKLDMEEINVNLQNFLNNSIEDFCEALIGSIEKLPGSLTDSIEQTGVMEAFFSFLHIHKMLCEQMDVMDLDFLEIDYEEPSEDYRTRFGNEWLTFCPLDIVEKIKEYFNNYKITSESNNDIRKIVNLILYDKKETLSTRELQYYKFTLRKTEKVIRWIQEQNNYLGYTSLFLYYNQKFHQEGIILPSETISPEIQYFCQSADDGKIYIRTQLLISIIQEIYFVVSSDKKKIIQNRFYGYNNSGQTLTAVLENKNDDINHSKTILAWIKRTENRMIINLGLGGALIEKRKLHKTLLEIKKHIYQYSYVEKIYYFSCMVIRILNFYVEIFKRRMQGECGMHDENTVFLIQEDGTTLDFHSQKHLEECFPDMEFIKFKIEFKRKNTNIF